MGVGGASDDFSNKNKTNYTFLANNNNKDEYVLYTHTCGQKYLRFSSLAREKTTLLLVMNDIDLLT